MYQNLQGINVVSTWGIVRAPIYVVATLILGSFLNIPAIMWYQRKSTSRLIRGPINIMATLL